MSALKLMMSGFLLALVVSLLSMMAYAETSGVDWERGIIRAKGFAAGKSGEKRIGLALAQARRAARMDAMRNLAESVRGVRVTGDSSMRDLELEYDIVRTSVEGTVRNLQEVGDPIFHEDGTCEVILELPLYGASSLSESAFLPYKDTPKIPFPQPSMSVPETQTGYTGLIVDCSGLGLQPVMSPVIKDDKGNPIYGYKNLDYDKVVSDGMASYYKDAKSQNCAGINPLVIKAVKVDNNHSNPVVKVSDAALILTANQKDKFLDNCAVVFIW